jgi:hypothetical protein
LTTQNTGSTHELIGSDRVEGTTVYDASGHPVGTIKRLMIEKRSGKVAYAVMVFGGFLGLSQENHAIPWERLRYDTNLHGYRTDIVESELKGSPGLITEDEGWLDSAKEEELKAHFRIPPHARSI